jgi:hypothetical protein
MNHAVRRLQAYFLIPTPLFLRRSPIDAGREIADV